MNFADAWNEKLIAASNVGEKNRKQNIRARINFDQGEATMVVPGYFKNEDFARDTLARAWETYCRNKENTVNSINSIIIEEVNSFDFIHRIHASNQKSA